MRADPATPPHVGIRCDAGATRGVGHLVRCMGLAEELLSRGWRVTVVGDLGGVAFAHRQVDARGLPLVAPRDDAAAAVRQAAELGLDAVVVDSYTLPPDVSRGWSAAGLPVLAFADGDLRGQHADVYVDQNLGAEHDHVGLPPGSRRLAGTRYAVLRDVVRDRRPPAPWHQPAPVQRVVVAFGGTDAFGLTGTTARALAEIDVPARATLVTPDPEVRAAVAALPSRAVRLAATAPVDDLPALLAGADLVVGAAGTSSWEVCCLGRPAVLAAVVDNQELAYGRLVDLGAVLPLGHLDEVRGLGVAALAGTLAAALGDVDRRARAAAVAHGLVDGRGRERVADALDSAVRTEAAGTRRA